MILFLKKIKNTFLTPRIYDLVVDDNFYKNYIKTYNKRSLFVKVFLRIFYFYPNLHDLYLWKYGKSKNYRCYSDFEKVDENHIFILNYLNNIIKKKNNPILDLACNQGRDIRYLYKKGFRNLYGVDIMHRALLHFKKKNKNVFNNSNIKCDYLQKYVSNIKSNFFFATYTFGATIELVHPSYDIIKNLVRITKKYILLYINENEHYYPRFYRYEFKKNGSRLIFEKNFGRMTFLVFKNNNNK